MTRTALALSTLKPNDILDMPNGSAIDQGNGMSIALSSTAIPAAPGAEQLFLFVATTNGVDKTVTVKAGANPPAFRAALGDLTVTAKAANGGGIIGPLESARFLQADEKLYIDFQSGITGTITAFIAPLRW
jgi:hypothetical protein